MCKGFPEIKLKQVQRLLILCCKEKMKAWENQVKLGNTNSKVVDLSIHLEVLSGCEKESGRKELVETGPVIQWQLPL